jgi:omega-amidase
MRNELKVTILQSDLFWENPDANRRMFSEKINNIIENTDLIVLPEMFTTGFTMNASLLAESESGQTLDWMKIQANKKNSALVGSFIVFEKNNFYNRLFFVKPNGDYYTYDKRHTFTLADEHLTYTSGKELLTINFLGWKICPLICYDLRFPVWARNTCDYDLLIYTANWPQKRIHAWDTLLRARAIENMAYCVGVNRTGKDDNLNQYNGHSAIYDVLGKQLTTTKNEGNFSETIILEKIHIVSERAHFQFLSDRDHFTLN